MTQYVLVSSSHKLDPRGGSHSSAMPSVRSRIRNTRWLRSSTERSLAATLRGRRDITPRGRRVIAPRQPEQRAKAERLDAGEYCSERRAPREKTGLDREVEGGEVAARAGGRAEHRHGRSGPNEPAYLRERNDRMVIPDGREHGEQRRGCGDRAHAAERDERQRGCNQRERRHD